MSSAEVVPFKLPNWGGLLSWHSKPRLKTPRAFPRNWERKQGPHSHSPHAALSPHSRYPLEIKVKLPAMPSKMRKTEEGALLASSEEVFEVETIMAKAFVKGRVQYLLKWKGFPESVFLSSPSFPLPFPFPPFPSNRPSQRRFEFRKHVGAEGQPGVLRAHRQLRAGGAEGEGGDVGGAGGDGLR